MCMRALEHGPLPPPARAGRGRPVLRGGSQWGGRPMARGGGGRRGLLTTGGIASGWLRGSYSCGVAVAVAVGWRPGSCAGLPKRGCGVEARMRRPTHSGATAGLRRGYGGAAPRLRRGCRKGRGPAGRRFRRARRAVQAASCTSALRPVTSVWPQTWLGLGLGLGLGDGRLATDRPGDERRRRVWNPEPVTLAEAAARASGYPRALSGAAAPPECGAPRRA
jgi:hypothetical protein